MSNNILQRRAERVEEAFRLLENNKDNQGNIPGILRQLISLKVWEGYDWRGDTVTFSTFREFVETPLPKGLGTTIDELVKLSAKYLEIVELIDVTVQEQSPDYEPPKKGNNIIPIKKSKVSSLQRNMRTLRSLSTSNSQAAKLRKEVLDGKLTAGRALIMLKKRPKRIGVQMTPQAAAQALKTHFSKEEIKQLIDLLRG